MKNSEFRQYQSKTIEQFKKILASHELGHCDEQGLPSYTNPNPLMRWLVWKRVRVVLDTINKLPPSKNALDFGCGYGIFTPYLLENAKNVVAFDPMIDELKPIGSSLGWKGISYSSQISELSEKTGKFDLILAIEVLEHVENLDEMVHLFRELLSPNGSLIIAGPTENILYKIGRQLSGYSGEYHVRNIRTIQKNIQRSFVTKKIASIIPVFTFYEIYICR